MARPALNVIPGGLSAGAASSLAASIGLDRESLSHVITADDIGAALASIGAAEIPLLRRESAMPDDLTDAKIAKAQAETETKIVRMEGAINTTLATIVGKIDALSGQVSDQRRDRNLIIGTIVLAALALGGLFWGAITYGDAIFGRGMSVRDVVQSVIKEQQQKPKDH